MASNYTENYGLCQWEPGDNFVRTEFNQDNAKIDAALKSVADAAAQVRVLQRKGIRVSAVFMGEDRSAADAARIYGKNMARIRGMDQLARAAGRLIQNEIRELGD